MSRVIKDELNLVSYMRRKIKGKVEEFRKRSKIVGSILL